jgi:hypothetical protein
MPSPSISQNHAVWSDTIEKVTLENMFLGQGILWQQVFNCLNAVQAQTPSSQCENVSSAGSDTLKECTSRLRATLSNLSVDLGSIEPPLQSPLKRRRKDSVEDQPHMPPIPYSNTEYELPSNDLVDSLVEIYFANIHPWIPILHVKQFRQRMAVPSQRPKLTTILHAIVSLCARFSLDLRLSDPDVRNMYTKRSRQTVILQSMESFSVENLQALVICAFDTVIYIKAIANPSNNFTDWQWTWPFSLVYRWKYDEDRGAAAIKRGRRGPASGSRTAHQAHGIPTPC